MSLSLNQWIDKIQALHPKQMELGLDRISIVANQLNLPAKSTQNKIIVVGGTNGKGTTVAILEALFKELGKQVFSYSSPHLLTFNERIRINGKPVDDATLVKSFETIASHQADIRLTFFEFTTLAAMLIDSQFNPHYSFYEIGLGGRLDAVNILQPDISVLTSIGLDHTDWLGDNLVKICEQKIAIARPGKPLVVADDLIADECILLATKKTNKIYQLGSDFHLMVNDDGVEVSFKKQQIKLVLPESVHPKNFAGACVVASLLGIDFNQSEALSAAQTAVAKLFLPGRFESVSISPNIFVDVSHNQQAISQLQFKLKQLEGPVRLVCAMLSDKLNETILEPLSNQDYVWYLATLDAPRGADAEEISQCISNETQQKYKNIQSAIKSALDDANGCGSIVIFGSFLTVEAGLKMFNNTKEFTQF